MKRVGIYLKVSPEGQATEDQRRELEAVAARSGWHVVGLYEDAESFDGRNPHRSAFDRLLKDAAARKIDMIITWSVNWLGRSLRDLVRVLTQLQTLECDLYLHQQGLDTSTPVGKGMFQMVAAFAEFERAVAGEGVSAGLVRAKGRGTKVGRRPVTASIEKRILELRAEGMGILKIGRTLGIGTWVVQRVVLLAEKNQNPRSRSRDGI
ncbi:DNA invertase Pin-like site-specific DNA recombinase [Bradyrhizobium sp. USDA 4354]